MKVGITRSIMLMAAIAAMVVIMGSTAVWAQCATPNYSPDFSSTSAQACLTLNGIQYGGPPTYPSTGYPGFYQPSPTSGTTVLRLTPNGLYWAGSAWYTTPQPVANGFSTTFTFQVSTPAADGIAFVVQNSPAGVPTSALSALGPEGCGEGFGSSSTDPNCTPVSGPQAGIPSSVAIRFDTYAQPQINDPAGNDVTIQSCGTSANTVDLGCRIAGSYNVPVTMGNGSVHTATISYTPTPTLANSPNCFSDSTPEPCLDVILDGNDLFAGGIVFDMNSIGLASGGNAWVGLTGATGGATATQDILSWTFSTQSQSQTSTVTPTSPATYNYNGGCNSNGSGCTGNGYTDAVAENPGSSNTINNLVVTPIPIIAPSGLPSDSQALCNSIVNPPGILPAPWASAPGSNPAQTAQCFVYTNGGGQGIDAPVLFSISCPAGSGGQCDTLTNQFLAAITTSFTFTCDENSPLTASTCAAPLNSPGSFGNFLDLTSTTGLPAVGFLQGAGPDPNNPCTPSAGSALFTGNQIVSYTLGDTSSAPMKGGSTGLTSCWVATYDTPNELPTATIAGASNNADYAQNSTVVVNYTCTAASTAPDSVLGTTYPAQGPYLTLNTCTATSGLTAGGGTPTNSTCTATYPPALNACTTSFNLDTSELGPHTLTVDVEDSATNTAQQQITYNVQGNQLPLTLVTTSPLSFNQSETLSYTGGSTAGAVSYTVTSGPCSITGALLNQLTANSGTGSCTVTATMAGNSNYNPVTSAPANIVTLALVPQTITFSTSAPSSAAYNSSFTVAATGGASGNSVVFSSSGVCSITGTTTGTATYKMTNSTGTCSVIANQLGNGNYSAAPTVTQTVSANGPLVTMTPTSTNLGTAYYGLALDPVVSKVQNTGTAAAALAPTLTLGSGATNKLDFTLLDNFQPFNLCSSTLAAAKTCYYVVVAYAGNVGTLSATLNVATNSPGTPLTSTFSLNVINPQASFNPISVSFPTEKVSSHGSSTTNVTLTNTGSGLTPLNITSVSITGTGKSQFPLSNGCGSSLAAGATCIIAVKFAPTSTGTSSAALTVTDNALAGGGTQTVPLSGKGN